MKKCLLLFSITLVFLTTNLYSSTVYTKINASDTGYVRERHVNIWYQSNPDTYTYSAYQNNVLRTYKSYNKDGATKTWVDDRGVLKFDLTSIATLGIPQEDIESITLGITYASGGNHTPLSNIVVYSMSGTVSSGILTSDFNKLGSTLRTITPQEVSQYALFEMDVTSIINLNDNYEGFIIRYLTLNDVWNHTFSGNSDPTYFPYLKIGYKEVVPEPATMVLLGLGIIELIRKKRK